MKIIASPLPESILCTLPNGEHVEVTMLCVEGDDYCAVPNIQGALELLMNHFGLESNKISRQFIGLRSLYSLIAT